jgi:MFS family permease
MLADKTKSDPSRCTGIAPNSSATANWRALLSEGNAAVSIVLTGGVAMHALSLRVVATVLPAVVAEIGGLRFFAWTTTVAIVSAIWGAAFAAPLARSQGVRGAYRVSLLLFAAGSIACATAPDMGIFLAGRLGQGLGGGLLTALAYTTIRRVFPENLRTRAIVLVSGIWGVAALSGPLLGGVLAEWGVWRWAFWIDVPIAAAVGLSAEYALPKSAEPASGSGMIHARTALGRLALLGAAVLAVAIGGVSGDALLSGIGLIIGTALLTILLRAEQTSAGGIAPFRLLPSGAYRPGNVLGAVSLSMALMVGCTTAVLYLPYVSTEIGGYSPIMGGYLSAIVSLSWTAAAFASGSAGHQGAERSIMLGPVLVALGMFLTGCALIVGSLVFVALALLLVGGGIGIAWAHLGNLMMSRAKETEHDVSSAFITTNQMIAQAFASALAGMIANLGGFADAAVGPMGVANAVAWLFLWFGLIAAAALPASVISVRLSKVRPASESLG